MISLLTPTRERPQRFAKMVDSAIAMAVNDFEVVAVLNKDDQSFDRYPKFDNVTYVRVPKRTDGKLSGLWNEAAKKATGDILMMCADDFIFETAGWDVMIETAISVPSDRIVMVYGSDHSARQAPIFPAVSREWFEAAGEFTPDHLQGWFSDEWIWSIAAELRRVIYLPQLTINHEQASEIDPALREQLTQRQAEGGIDGMRKAFYSAPEVRKRDERVARLRRVMQPGIELKPHPTPAWFAQSLEWAAASRIKVRNPDTLVVVHAWSGDQELVERHLESYLHHDCDVLVLSPEDAPVRIKHPRVRCHSLGKRGYFGQDSLDRQRLHLEYLLTQPYEYFLLNDADSFCISPDIPAYLYSDRMRGVAWSNEVTEWREHPSPYPKIAMQPPYFMHRSAIQQMLTVADSEAVKAHPITPYIDWYMLALCEESGVQHQTFPDGASFPAWRRNVIPETQALGHEPKHEYVPDGKIVGDDIMAERVNHGAVFLHSIKHAPVYERLVKLYEAKRHARALVDKRVSILVPWRPEQKNRARDKSWAWVRARWEHLYPDAEIVTGTDRGGVPFSKTTAVNDAYHKATGDVFVVADADAWIEPEGFKQAVDVARRTGRLVVPWKGVLRLNADASAKVMRRKPTSELKLTEALRADPIQSPIPETAGTLYVIRRDAFETVQGMDPRFRGWGFEDVAFARACETLLGPIVYLHNEVISLYHPRPGIDGKRVWEDDPGETNIDLAKAYASATRNPGAMRDLCNQHPLHGEVRQLVPPARDDRMTIREYQARGGDGETFRIAIG